MHPVKNSGKSFYKVQMKIPPPFFTGQTTPLTKISPEREEAQNGGGNLSQKLEGNLSPKLGEKLRPIQIPDLGDRSHCPWMLLAKHSQILVHDKSFH